MPRFSVSTLLRISLLGLFIFSLVYLLVIYPTNHGTMILSYARSVVVSSEGKQKSSSASIQKKKEMLDPKVNIFHAMGLEDERHLAVTGGPLEYLPEYESPCWSARYDKKTPYQFTSLLVKSHAKKAKEFLRAIQTGTPTRRLRCLPAIYLIGAPGCGTTDLYYRMINNSNGRIPEPISKEPYFWVERHHNKDMLTPYIDLYDPTASIISKRPFHSGIRQGLIIDASSQMLFKDPYWYSLPANAKLKEPKYGLPHMLMSLYNNTKIMVMLREPVARIYSQYKTNRGRRATPINFDKYIRILVPMFEICFANRGIRECLYDFSGEIRKIELQSGVVVRPSLYYTYLHDWFEVFGKERMMIIKSEDYYKNHTKIIDQLYGFLGIENHASISAKDASQNAANSHKTADMFPETKQYLMNFLKPHTYMLLRYLDYMKYPWVDDWYKTARYL